MRYKVLIVGAGQLGSRYLQGLRKVSIPLEITVLDPSPESLERAEKRWLEIPPLVAHNIVYVSDVHALPSILDLAIVATTADVRVAVVENLLRYAQVRAWVLEKVLAQSSEDLQRLLLLIGPQNAWVNTPMYLWPLYQKIRDSYNGNIEIAACFEGFRGLACNAIHYIDFVSRWNGAPLIDVNVSALQPEWYASKREGFYEVDGEITMRFADGSNLRLASDRNKLGYTVKLNIGSDQWNVSESEGAAHSSDGRSLNGTIEFQSQLTAPMVEAIFAGASCGLPTLMDSVQQHTLFINALLAHWNRHMPNKCERLPIT